MSGDLAPLLEQQQTYTTFPKPSSYARTSNGLGGAVEIGAASFLGYAALNEISNEDVRAVALACAAMIGLKGLFEFGKALFGSKPTPMSQREVIDASDKLVQVSDARTVFERQAEEDEKAAQEEHTYQVLKQMDKTLEPVFTKIFQHLSLNGPVRLESHLFDNFSPHLGQTTLLNKLSAHLEQIQTATRILGDPESTVIHEASGEALDALRKTLGDKELEITRLSNELDRKKSELSRAQLDTDSNTELLKKKNAEIQILTTERDQAQAALNAALAQLSTLKPKLEEAQGAHQAALRQISTQQEKHRAVLDNTSRAHEEELKAQHATALRAQTTALDALRKELSQNYEREKVQLVESLRHENQTATHRLTESATNARDSAVAEKQAEMQTIVDGMQQRIDQLIAHKNQTKAVVTQQFEDLQNEHEVQVQRLQGEIAQLKTQKEADETLAETLKGTLQKLAERNLREDLDADDKMARVKEPGNESIFYGLTLQVNALVDKANGGLDSTASSAKSTPVKKRGGRRTGDQDELASLLDV